MGGAAVIHHFIHPGTVLGGLEGIGLEIFVIVRKVKGVGGQYLPLFFQLQEQLMLLYMTFVLMLH